MHRTNNTVPKVVYIYIYIYIYLYTIYALDENASTRVTVVAVFIIRVEVMGSN